MKVLLSLAFVVSAIAHPAMAQDTSASPTPTHAPPLIWQRLVHLHDGRTFVSDGPFSIDAALAKPAIMPSHVLPDTTAKLIEGYLTAELPNEFSSSQLTLIL